LVGPLRPSTATQVYSRQVDVLRQSSRLGLDKLTYCCALCGDADCQEDSMDALDGEAGGTFEHFARAALNGIYADMMVSGRDKPRMMMMNDAMKMGMSKTGWRKLGLITQ
jgi:2-hydroxychromene-2-carboxylate isomerase